MEHKFGHSDTLECCFLGNISTFPGSFPTFADLYPAQVCLRAKRGELKQVVGDGADHARGQVVVVLSLFSEISIFCQDERALQGTLQLHL